MDVRNWLWNINKKIWVMLKVGTKIKNGDDEKRNIKE